MHGVAASWKSDAFFPRFKERRKADGTVVGESIGGALMLLFNRHTASAGLAVPEVVSATLPADSAFVTMEVKLVNCIIKQVANLAEIFSEF